MACGIPVIAPNSTTAPEVIGDAGLLFTQGDPNDLANKVIKLLSDDDLRKNLSSKSIKRVNEYFRHNIMAMKYREIYHKLLADAPYR